MKTILKCLLLPFVVIATLKAQETTAPVEITTDAKKYVNVAAAFAEDDALIDTSEDQLVKRANNHFKNLEYYQAAKIYDHIFEKQGISNASTAVIEQAANCNYLFNNVDRAAELYANVYAKKEHNMSTLSLFRYVHTLKGIGDDENATQVEKEYLGKVRQQILVGTKGVRMHYDKIYDINVSNLNLNSGLSEFAPMYAGKNKLMFASSKNRGLLKKNYKWNKQPFLDIYMAELDATKKMVAVEKLPKEINSKLHEASVTFTPDGKTMYFTRNHPKRNNKREMTLKIHKSELNDKGEWSKSKELPFNDPNFSFGHPAVSPDGQALYFVSDMPGGYGQTDIYKVQIKGNGNYSEPANLGEQVNSTYNEAFPFVSNNKIYFSSNRTNGYGGMDIYEADKVEDEFLEAKNMGQPFNSNRDDISFIINEENKEGYFASNRKGGKGDDDIYHFSLAEKDLTGTINGIVENENDTLIANTIIQLLDKDGNLLKEVTTDDNGNFNIEGIIKGNTYTIKVNHPDYKLVERVVEGEWSDDQKTINIRLEPRTIPLPKVVTENNVKKIDLAPVHFDFDKYNVREDAEVKLRSLIRLLNENSNMVIKIEAHTDARGSMEYNQILSDKRARSIQQFLLTNGIDAKQIQSAKGFGEEHLINDCVTRSDCTNEMHELNRRTEFIIVQ